MSTSVPPPIPNSAPEKTPGMAIASLVFGILSVLGGVALLFPPILAVVFGHITRSRIERQGTKAGAGISLAGLIMGYVSLAMIPIIGLLAAMAIPAFQKVRSTSQEKVMINNARMISAAAEQYYLETDSDFVGLSDIAGPNKYLPKITPIAGETYPTVLHKGQPIVVHKKDGKDVVYNPE